LKPVVTTGKTVCIAHDNLIGQPRVMMNIVRKLTGGHT
jgi:hypothetical protein